MKSPVHVCAMAAAIGVVGCHSRTVPVADVEPGRVVATAPMPQPVVEVQTFTPSRDGFRFKNSFSGSPLPKMMRGLAAQLGASVPNRYGLCGGMSSAAADYFFARTAPPSVQTPPSEGSPLYEYLYDRQLDSLGTGMFYAAKVGRWMMLDDLGRDGTQARTKPEVQKIKDEIKARGVAMVYLVFGGPDGKTPLWENHQVLAYQADDDAIRIYDPNFPGDDTAKLAITQTSDGVSVERRTARGNKAVRGIFLGVYESKAPPK